MNVRLAALLHDIGKPSCWAVGGYWSEHVHHTFDIVRGVLGEDIARTAMRHHTGSSYPEDLRPHSEEEWIVWLADNLSSGSDRREDPEKGSFKPKPPFTLTHPLSDGSTPVLSLDVARLAEDASGLVRGLREAAEGSRGDLSEVYSKVYRRLEGSRLKAIPADTRPPINDVSLWHHSKLTTAIAGCISEGGFRGSEASDYSFILMSGDADRVSQYIREAKRIPDLNARSERVKHATDEAGKAVARLAGPECLLFAGGGSLLALLPPGLKVAAEADVVERFVAVTGGEVTFTVSSLEVSGDELQSRFGELWERAGSRLRQAKLDRAPAPRPGVGADERLCDVCGRRPASREDPERLLPVDASPRFEALCEECWALRASGKGVWVQDLEGSSRYLALVKADGDGVGDVLSGRALQGKGKSVTPSRLSTISELIDTVCEANLSALVTHHGGQVIFAGGDDLLAVLPGEEAFSLALEASKQFKGDLGGAVTLSAGIALSPARQPVYLALQDASRLLKEAKGIPGKGAVAYNVVTGRSPSVSKPMKWGEFEELLGLVSFLKSSGLPSSQLRMIASTAKEKPDETRALIKYNMGRGVLAPVWGDKLLEAVESGSLAEAFRVYNLLR